MDVAVLAGVLLHGFWGSPPLCTTIPGDPEQQQQRGLLHPSLSGAAYRQHPAHLLLVRKTTDIKIVRTCPFTSNVYKTNLKYENEAKIFLLCYTGDIFKSLHSSDWAAIFPHTRFISIHSPIHLYRSAVSVGPSTLSPSEMEKLVKS